MLVQGWKITEKNVDEFLGAVQRQLKFIEDAVAKVSGNIHEQFERERKKSLVEVSRRLSTIPNSISLFINSTTVSQQIELKKSTEALFNDSQEMSFTPTSPNIAMVSPGSGFLNLLRYGMLALKLLPISNFSSTYFVL